MEPFIGQIFLFETSTDTMPLNVDAQDETPAISGGLDRDIIRRKAKDHANEVDPEEVDQIEFVDADAPEAGHSKGVYPLIYIPSEDFDPEPEPQADFVINDDLIVDGSIATDEGTEAFLF